MHPDQVLELDLFTFNDMWKAITVLEAQEFLIQANLSMLPHMKQTDREELLREMHRQAYPRQFRPEAAAMTAKELAEQMALRGRSGR